jgi:hypothetical protein
MTDINNATETLEALIDRHGLLHVVTGLEMICSEKAEHIRANWQDKVTARPWDRAANRLYTVVRDIDDLGI